MEDTRHRTRGSSPVWDEDDELLAEELLDEEYLNERKRDRVRDQQRRLERTAAIDRRAPRP